ncbi:MAG TPA: hypothetical protein VNF47_19165 [Streptosporangiaceae bacterium]|nr:hypothetical protein [Streptosporangiaceae bacterium]
MQPEDSTPEPDARPSEVNSADTSSAGLPSEVERSHPQARSARQAYWFPLILFGLLLCASVPFYIRPPTVFGISFAGSSDPRRFLPAFGGFPGPGLQDYLAYYWIAAIAIGLTGTVLWYRRYGRRSGPVIPTRGFLVTGAVVMLAALLIQLLLRRFMAVLWGGDLTMRGTFPLVMIAPAFWVLARAERSWPLAVIALVYTGTALLASLYDLENVLFRLGRDPSSGWQERLTSLPNVLLPALILLGSGAGAFAAQRRRASAA